MNILAFGMPGGIELVMIAGIGLLIFGRKLPGIARSCGQSIVEFKKGIKGISDGADEVKADLKQIENDIKI